MELCKTKCHFELQLVNECTVKMTAPENKIVQTSNFLKTTIGKLLLERKPQLEKPT